MLSVTSGGVLLIHQSKKSGIAQPVAQNKQWKKINMQEFPSELPEFLKDFEKSPLERSNKNLLIELLVGITRDIYQFPEVKADQTRLTLLVETFNRIKSLRPDLELEAKLDPEVSELLAFHDEFYEKFISEMGGKQ